MNINELIEKLTEVMAEAGPTAKVAFLEKRLDRAFDGPMVLVSGDGWLWSIREEKDSLSVHKQVSLPADYMPPSQCFAFNFHTGELERIDAPASKKMTLQEAIAEEMRGGIGVNYRREMGGLLDEGRDDEPEEPGKC